MQLQNEDGPAINKFLLLRKNNHLDNLTVITKINFPDINLGSIMRSREVESRQAHTLKIAGANPASAIVLRLQN